MKNLLQIVLRVIMYETVKLELFFQGFCYMYCNNALLYIKPPSVNSVPTCHSVYRKLFSEVVKNLIAATLVTDFIFSSSMYLK